MKKILGGEGSNEEGCGEKRGREERAEKDVEEGYSSR